MFLLDTNTCIYAIRRRPAAVLARLNAVRPDQVALSVIVAKPRVAIALGKQLFYRQLEAGIEAAYDDAARTMACNMMDGAALEGVQAFIEKRPAKWGSRSH